MSQLHPDSDEKGEELNNAVVLMAHVIDDSRGKMMSAGLLQ